MGPGRVFGRRLVVMDSTLARRGTAASSMAGNEACLSILPCEPARGWRISARGCATGESPCTDVSSSARRSRPRSRCSAAGRAQVAQSRRSRRAAAEARPGQGRLHARRTRQRDRHRGPLGSVPGRIDAGGETAPVRALHRRAAGGPARNDGRTSGAAALHASRTRRSPTSSWSRPTSRPRESRDWLRAASAGTDVTMSVCTGAFQLARAGLLKGIPATTHHDFFDSFAKEFPDIELTARAAFRRQRAHRDGRRAHLRHRHGAAHRVALLRRRDRRRDGGLHGVLERRLARPRRRRSPRSRPWRGARAARRLRPRTSRESCAPKSSR